MIRKNIFTFFIFLFLTLLLPVSVGAQGTNEEAVPISTEGVDVSEYEKAKVTNSGSIYITGENEVIENNINNDVVFGGGELVINGDVLDNVIFAGAAVEINGNVDGDILFAGGTLILNGDVSGDIRAFGGAIFINSNTIEGDVLVTAGQVSILQSSNILGELETDGWDVNERATDNPTTIEAAESMDMPFSEGTLSSALTGLAVGVTFFAIIWAILMLIGTIISGYFVLRVFPVFTEKTLRTMKDSPWQSVGVGCLTLIGAFFAAILLAISVIGIRLLLLLAVLAVLAYMFGAVYGRYEVGRMILSKFGKENTGRLWVLVTGVLVVDVLLGILTFIPFIGGFVGILTMFIALWGLGAIVMNKYNSLYKKEKVVKEKKEVKK